MIQRLASPAEDRLARLASVHQAAFAPASRGWSTAEIATLASAGALFADDRDRGFVLFSHAADEAELLTIAVHPDCRRQGLARELMATARENLSKTGARTIFLEVAADNLVAIALYVALGFSAVGTRRGYYRRSSGARVDALMMSLEL